MYTRSVIATHVRTTTVITPRYIPTYTGGRTSGNPFIRLAIWSSTGRPDILVSNKNDDQTCYSITKKKMKYLF